MPNDQNMRLHKLESIDLKRDQIDKDFHSYLTHNLIDQRKFENNFDQNSQNRNQTDLRDPRLLNSEPTENSEVLRMKDQQNFLKDFDRNQK